MATKKTNISELEQQCLEAKKNFELLQKQLEVAKKEEEEEKRAKLEAEKATRKKEIDDAFETYKKLLTAYMDDYGVYSGVYEDGVFDLFSSKFWNSIF